VATEAMSLVAICLHSDWLLSRVLTQRKPKLHLSGSGIEA